MLSTPQNDMSTGGSRVSSSFLVKRVKYNVMNVSKPTTATSLIPATPRHGFGYGGDSLALSAQAKIHTSKVEPPLNHHQILTTTRPIPVPRRQVFQPNTSMAATQGEAVSKKRKFVADGVFYAELNEFFQRELAEEGYSGVEVRVTPTVTDISELSRCIT